MGYFIYSSNSPETERTEEVTRGEDREVFERRYHISAEEQSNGRADASSNNQVSRIYNFKTILIIF